MQTRSLIAQATKLALRERRPLSDYASIVGWEYDRTIRITARGVVVGSEGAVN